MAVQNIRLYEFMKERECHLFEDEEGINACIIIYFCDLEDFAEIVGSNAFDDGGMEVRMFEDYVAIDVRWIFESEEEFLYEYRACFEEDEFERYQGSLEKEFEENQ